jgi:hypothetical protein
MQHSAFLEANRFSASQEIPRILWNKTRRFITAFASAPHLALPSAKMNPDHAPAHFLKININPLNAELNAICCLLVLLGDLTFMDPCFVSIFQYKCISNKMQSYTIYLYLETALYVLGGTSTHH